MSLLRHLTALLHRERCDRAVLIPMLDKLSPREVEALYRLLENAKNDAGAAQRHKLWDPFRRH